jgi:PAS domain S-box-containing protein
MRDITERKQAEKQRVRLLSREWAAREEAETLLEISKTIAAELNIETLLQKITDASTNLSGAEFGAFFYNVVNAKGESYMLYALSGAPREEFQKLGLPRNTPLFEPTFCGTGVVRIDDVLKDSRYGTMAPHYGMPKGHLPVRSYLAVPVKSRSGEVLGGLFFGHSESGVFTERAERCVLGIAAQAAIAIDNARLFSGFQAEIVQRKQAEESLRESELRKDAVLAAATDCLITMDHEGRIIDFNPSAEKTFGYKREDVVGQTVADTIIPLRFREAHVQGLRRYLTSGEQRVLGRRIEMPALRADGTEFPAELSIVEVCLKDRPSFFTAYLRDMSNH